MSVNRVILLGRLGRDPEMRATPDGTPVCTFSLATDESYTDKSGERQKQTEWHSIVAWRKLAELAQQYLTKGREIYIEGRLKTREWTDKEGNKRKSTEIHVSNMSFVGSKWDGEKKEAAEPVNAEPVTDDDLPF